MTRIIVETDSDQPVEVLVRSCGRPPQETSPRRPYVVVDTAGRSISEEKPLLELPARRVA